MIGTLIYYDCFIHIGPEQKTLYNSGTTGDV